MSLRLNSTDKDFEAKLKAHLAKRNRSVSDVAPVVTNIVGGVKNKGDAALLECTEKFDRLKLKASGLRITDKEIAQAEKDCPADVKAALKLAAERIRAYHEKQTPQNEQYKDAQGITLGWQYAPLESVGIYVPGGKASYPSTVLMNAVPAAVAGVARIVMTMPTPDGVINPAVLVAASLAGVHEIYRVGGAQAVAALAYGTATIAPVVKIVGPGNAYVAEAKRQVFGTVGIDTIAGPSEVLIVADAKNEPPIIAADLLSQAEHDELAQSILVTNDAKFADAIAAEVKQLLTVLPKSIAKRSWEEHGAIITIGGWHEALPIIAIVAPEHAQLAIDNPEALAPKIRHAGAIFLGRHTAEALGDYLAGPSHVLPTSGAAKFSSGLSVFDFLLRTSLIGAPAGAKALNEAAATLADTEGLPAHALSLRLRIS